VDLARQLAARDPEVAATYAAVGLEV
jgi:hypothetical protein